MTRLSLAPLIGGADEDWRERSLCPQTDPEIFFPDVGHTANAAKKICNQCEVRAACLEWALASGETSGVWGGLSEAERRRLLRRPIGVSSSDRKANHNA